GRFRTTRQFCLNHAATVMRTGKGQDDGTTSTPRVHRNARRRSGRAISEDPMPQYKCKSIAALDIALGGLPAKMRVEADVGTGVSAKTVGELRKVTTWSENWVII